MYDIENPIYSLINKQARSIKNSDDNSIIQLVDLLSSMLGTDTLYIL